MLRLPAFYDLVSQKLEFKASIVEHLKILYFFRRDLSGIKIMVLPNGVFTSFTMLRQL